MAENGANGNGNAERALEEIRELKRTHAEAIKDQTNALNGINTKLGHIEGMIAVAAGDNANLGREVATLRQQVNEQRDQITTLKIKVEASMPLQKLGWAILTAIVLGGGGMIASNIMRPITVQMPASAAP